MKKGRPITHGMSGTQVRRAWASIKSRCYNHNDPNYKKYGARGITVCDRWLNSFENFYADMGDPPDDTSIERKDNDLGYSPENCRWATAKDQCRNRRGNRMLTYNGETLCVAEWSELRGIHRSTIFTRLRLGWTIERTLTKGVMQDD